MPIETVSANSEYINFGTDSSLDVGSADFCVMCWFNVSTDGDEIVSKGRFADIGPGWQLRRNITGGGHILAAFGDGSDGFDIAQTAASFPLNTWAHAAMVRDNTNTLYRLYIDGVEVDTTAILNASGSLDNSENLLIGAVNEPSGTPTRFMDGLIDDVRVYDRAPTADEIAEIHALQGKDVIFNGLIFHTRLDEFAPGASASGADSVRDHSGNGNHGTPIATPTGAEGILSFGRMVA